MSSESVPGTNPPEHAPVDTATNEAVDAQALADLKAAAQKGAEAQDRYVRLYADFENYKKRVAREKEDAKRAAIEGVITKLLPVVDTFEMAMQAAQMPSTTVETLKAGVSMIQGQFKGVLNDLGVEEIAAVGKGFDPSFHDAVSEQETAEVPEGQVVQQLRKGYRCKDRLLRPATVVVSKAPTTTAQAQTSQN